MPALGAVGDRWPSRAVDRGGPDGGTDSCCDNGLVRVDVDAAGLISSLGGPASPTAR